MIHSYWIRIRRKVKSFLVVFSYGPNLDHITYLLFQNDKPIGRVGVRINVISIDNQICQMFDLKKKVYKNQLRNTTLFQNYGRQLFSLH